MRVLSRLTGCAAAVLCTAGPVASQDRNPPAGGVVSSTGQQGGVTAYWIGQVNYQQTGPHDPDALQLASVIAAHQERAMRRSTALLEEPNYIFLMTGDSVPRRAGARSWEILNILILHESEFDPLCEIKPGYGLSAVISHVSGTGQAAQVSAHIVTQAELPLVQPICDSLRRPLSSIGLQPQTSSLPGADDSTTVFDYLSHGQGYLSLRMIPDDIFARDFESVIARYYWAGALTFRYYRYLTLEEAGDAAVGDTGASEVGRFNSPFALNLPSGQGLGAYPGEARQEFGDRIGRLDAQWMAYLVQSGLTIQGEQRPLMTGNRPTIFLPRFRRNQIGSPEFWRASSEVVRTFQMVDCIAARFLVDRGYREAATGTDPAQCAQYETRLSE